MHMGEGRVNSCLYSSRILPVATTKTLQYFKYTVYTILYNTIFNKRKLIFLTNIFTHILLLFLFSLDFNDLDSNIFLGPFLEVIRSEDTTGPITGVALSSINKFLSYGLIGKYF